MLRNWLIILIIFLSAFNIVCLIEVYYPVEVVNVTKLTHKDFKDKFTKCELSFGFKREIRLVDDINQYYNTPLYKTYEVTRIYGRVTGKLRRFNYKIVNYEDNRKYPHRR